MNLKIFICSILFSFGLSGIAQTKLNFKYYCLDFVETTRVSVYLKYSNNKIELLNDTVREFEKRLIIPTGKNDYILSVEFENKTIGKEALNYPFTLLGTETDIKVNVILTRNVWLEKEAGVIEIIKYYDEANHLEIEYLSEVKGGGSFRGPFFMLKNNSNDTIYGKHLRGYFWGTLSFLFDSVWSHEIFGQLDYDFVPRPPLFPDSTVIATVGSFGWQNELPKFWYRYTLLYYTTDKNTHKRLEKDNFIWRADTKKYYRLVYEFEVE